MKNNSKNRRLVITIMLVAVVLITIGGTFAYFITQAGRNEEQKLTIKTGNLALTFEDNDSGLTGNIMIGESREKLFIIRNTGTEPVTTNMIWDGLVNTYLEESLSYTLEYKTTEDGTYQSLETAHTNVPQSDRAEDYNLVKNITIPSKGVYYYKLTITFNNLKDVNQEADRTAILSTKFNLGDAVKEKTAVEKIIASAKTGTPTFASAATTDEGVYSMADDYGTSYYYRGAVENNYVKFGGFYWRIIRINGDGSVRMIYDGTQAWPNGNGSSTFVTSGADRFTHINTPWNETNSNDNKYVGWMYGGTNGIASTQKDGTTSTSATNNQTDSNAKKKIDEWYESNLKNNVANSNLDLTKYLGDLIFCNDRSTALSSENWMNGDTKKGFGAYETAYGSWSRFLKTNGTWNTTNPKPQFTCPQKNDAFTVSDITKGNGALRYPVGLITADEIVAAGSGLGKANRNYYLYKTSNYWYRSLSPSSFGSYAYIIIVSTDGSLISNFEVHTPGSSMAPVINIAPEYAKTLVGDGSMTKPYQIPGVE